MDRKIIKKAYQVDLNKIEEGYLYSPMICYAENRNKAKSSLLGENLYSDLKLAGEEEEVTYLTTPVVRCKSADKYDFEGLEMTQRQIDDELTERKRLSVLDEILNNKSIKYCYIRKRGYYRPNSCGYTDFKHRAGVYEKEKAVSHAKGCKEIWLEIIDIDEHNNMITSELNKEME